MPLDPRSTLNSAAARLSICWLVFAVACGDDPTSNRPVPASMGLLSPATQPGTPGWALPDSVIVEVLDAGGRALSGVAVTWTANNDRDVVERPADTTDIAGRASAKWTLGRREGEQTLSVVAGGLAPITVTANATIFHAASVTLGNGFACALTESGRAFCWGWNYEGQVGNGTAGPRVTVPVPVTGDLVFTSLAASGGHVCGLTAGGEVHCWGSNNHGEAGTGTVGPSVPVPTPVQTALRFTQISAGGVAPDFSNSTCGLTATGEAWCWGDNAFGQLGNGTTESSAVPVRVQSDVPFASIHAGFFHSCAIAVAGELWCWGEQETDIGAFGARPQGLYTTPVSLHPDFRFTGMVIGRNYSCGLTVQKKAFCWGANWFGSLGTGDGTQFSAVPLPVDGGLSFATLGASSFEEIYALTPEGMLYRWGSPGNDVQQLGPVPVTELRFLNVDSGWEPFDFVNGACGISPGNAVYCVRSDGLVRGVPAPAALQGR
ncbi:MAG: hypothetical protein ABI836_06730 [Gemmatimonadota bacterium]